MANRRLISQAVVEDDSFIDLSYKARLFYIYINLHCDDEGFCGNPKSIGRLADLSSTELPELLKELIDSNFLIKFDNSKVVVVTDWYRNNTINSNRWSATEYVEQRKQLTINDNRRYELVADGEGLTKPFFQTDTTRKKSVSVNHDVENVISYLVTLVPTPYREADTALKDQNIVSSVQRLLRDHSAQQVREAAKWTKKNRSPRTLSQLISNTLDSWKLPVNTPLTPR